MCRQLEVSEAAYHRGKKQYDGTQMETVKRLKELEKENSRLKKIGRGAGPRHEHAQGD